MQYHALGIWFLFEPRLSSARYRVDYAYTSSVRTQVLPEVQDPPALTEGVPVTVVLSF